MAKNLSDLREHLFDTLEQLKDKSNPMDLDRAKAIAGVAQAIINSATVEVKAMNASARDSAFFGIADGAVAALPAARTVESPRGKTCRDCVDLQKETPATQVLPSGTALCDSHYRKRTGLPAHTGTATHTHE